MAVAQIAISLVFISAATSKMTTITGVFDGGGLIAVHRGFWNVCS